MQPSLTDLGLLGGAAFVLGLILTPIIRWAAPRWGLVDHPDGRRKIHKKPIPVAGGLAVYLAASIVIWAAYLWLPSWQEDLAARKQSFLSLFLAATVIAAIGVFDDYKGIRGRYKLIGQIIAAAIVIGGGVIIRGLTILDSRVEFGNTAAWGFTLFWLLLAINSLNLIDGMDGLLGSIGFILCLTIGGMAFLNGNFSAACIALTLAGAVLAFLVFNFPPASIYMGDAGSMLIGLVVGTLAIEASLKGPATVALAAPVALMIIPIMDTSAAVIRRKLTGRSIYTTDRGHMHHVMLWNGLSNQRVLLTIGFLAIFAGGGALIASWQKNELFAFGSIIAVAVFLLVSRLFGHSEFLLLKERIVALGASMRHGHNPERVHQFKMHLQGSANWDEVWQTLTLSAEDLRLKTLTLDVNAPAFHEGYHARWERMHKDSAEAPGFWRAEIPLTFAGQVIGRLDVIGLRDESPAWQKLPALAKIAEGIELAVATMVAAKSHPAAGLPDLSLRSAEGLQLEKV